MLHSGQLPGKEAKEGREEEESQAHLPGGIEAQEIEDDLGETEEHPSPDQDR